MADLGHLWQTKLEYSHFEIDDILDHLGKYSPTVEGFFKNEENLPSVLIDQILDPNYFYFTAKHFLNIELLPLQVAILQELWVRPFPMLIGSRGLGKSFILAVYCVLRMLLQPGCKVVICGAAFRQSKIIFSYMETIWLNAPILRSMCNASTERDQGPRRDIDRCTIKIGPSLATALPIGDGTKIRGERAHYLIVDEFSAANPEIYETVLAGFAIVSASPIEKVKQAARRRLKKEIGIWSSDEEESYEKRQANQAVLSGTAYYSFSHFYTYFCRYRDIINSRGDVKKLTEILGAEPDENFSHRDYSIIRIPYTLLPESFMEEKHISRSRAIVNSSIFLNEFCACFAKDSQGFFRRSLIESCVCKSQNNIVLPSGKVEFAATLRGNPNSRYVMAIDPASERDNFSIVILEICEDHRRIVYCWTTTRNQHRDKIKHGSVQEQDFYAYCCRKIRDLMKVFYIEKIGLDSQGGGVAIAEALHDPDKLETGELPIWPTIDPTKAKESDNHAGLHILEIINFADSNWVLEANHGMRKDFEDKTLLFPFFDAISIADAARDDSLANRMHDTLEDCVCEIEDLKDELATIVHSQTPAGRDKWDTPAIKTSTKKGRQRKDRYSALLMANMIGRQMMRAPEAITYEFHGGFIDKLKDGGAVKGPMFRGPAWFTEAMNNVY